MGIAGPVGWEGNLSSLAEPSPFFGAEGFLGESVSTGWHSFRRCAVHGPAVIPWVYFPSLGPQRCHDAATHFLVDTSHPEFFQAEVPARSDLSVVSQRRAPHYVGLIGPDVG